MQREAASHARTDWMKKRVDERKKMLQTSYTNKKVFMDVSGRAIIMKLSSVAEASE